MTPEEIIEILKDNMIEEENRLFSGDQNVYFNSFENAIKRIYEYGEQQKKLGKQEEIINRSWGISNE